MRLAAGLGTYPVRIAGPPRVPSSTRRFGPRSGAGWALTEPAPERAGAIARPHPPIRNSLRVIIAFPPCQRPQGLIMGHFSNVCSATLPHAFGVVAAKGALR